MEVGEQHHMEALTLFDEDNNDSDDNSIVITYQYLQLHVRKAKRSVKLHKDSVLIDTGSTCSVSNYTKMIVNVRKNSKTLRAFTNGIKT